MGKLSSAQRTSRRFDKLVFSLSGTVKNGKGYFDIGIHWTDGSVIQAISEFDDIDFENIVTQIDSIIEQSRMNLVSEMMKEITIERPPHYGVN
jgi:predicted lipase